jgi:hypothetical protein
LYRDCVKWYKEKKHSTFAFELDKMVYTVLLDPQNPAGSQVEEDKLFDLVQNGIILATTQVWNGEKGRWVDAQAHSGLYSLFAKSLWDAWDKDADSILSTTSPIEEKQEEIEVVAASVEEGSIANFMHREANSLGSSHDAPKPVPLPKDRMSSFSEESAHGVTERKKEEEHIYTVLKNSISEDVPEGGELPMLPELSLIPLDEVSSPDTSFQQHPNDFYPNSDLINPPFLISEIPPRRMRPNFVSEPKRFSFVRVAVPIVLGALLILGTLNYLQSLSLRQYPQKKEVPQEILHEEGIVWKIEKEIREKVGEEIIPLTPEASFEDILHVELQRVGVISHQISASVTDWTGRKQDQPKKIDVRIRAESTGALDYDVATISLILGKYIEFYFLDVQRLEVCFAPDEEYYLCASLNPEVIRRFYLKRIDNRVFFEDIFSES